MRTEVRSSLRGLTDEWDRLAGATPRPSAFLKAWWLEGIAEADARFVVVLADDGRLLGGLALAEEPLLGVPRLRLLGSKLAADHLDLVADPASEHQVVDALRAWFRRPGQRIVDLVGVADGARLADAVPGAKVTVFDYAPWGPLPATYEEFLEKRSTSLRHLVDRPRRRLERQGVVHRVVTDGDPGPSLRALRRLHALQFGSRSEFLPHFHQFARAMPAGVERGEVVFHEFVADDEIIAVNVVFETGGCASYYQGGRAQDHRWRGSGTALMAEIVRRACERGCDGFDLLRGVESYKHLWVDEQRALLRVQAAYGAQAKAGVALARLKPAGWRTAGALV